MLFLSKRHLLLPIALLCVALLCPVLLAAQGVITKLRGTVVDSATQAPVMFANVVLNGTTVGTITSEHGEFFIETRQLSDTLQVSCLGYKTLHLPIKRGSYQELSIALARDNVNIETVMVVAGERQSTRIMRRAFERKEHNDPMRRQHSCRIYNKVEIDLNNVDDNLHPKRLFKHFDFIWNYMDTSAITGKSFLPIYISESESDYYMRPLPKFEREVVRASKISGISNASVSQFMGGFYQSVNVYDNYIKVFDQGLVSPMSSMGFLYYNYLLLDSAMQGNRWCYHISFKPRRSMEPAFVGDMWINDTTFAVVKIQVRMANTVNINYVKEFAASMEFAPVGDSLWFPSTSSLFVDFNMFDKGAGFFGHKTTSYTSLEFTSEFSSDIMSLTDLITVADTALGHSDSYWEQVRPFELTEREAGIYQMVDSVQEVPMYRTFVSMMNMFINRYYVIGPVEIGPYYQLYSFNDLEGHRFKFSARTSNQFSTNLMLSGFVAYGTKDKKFKYGGEVLYLFKKKPRLMGSLGYSLDVEQLGQSEDALTGGNIFASLLSRTPNNKLTLVSNCYTGLVKEWPQVGLRASITLMHRRIMPSEFIAFERFDGTGAVAHVSTTGATIALRWKQNERLLSGEFERVSLGSNWPELVLTATQAMAEAGRRYPYWDLRARIIYKLRLNMLGYSQMMAEAGRILGTVPYPLLRLHEGNETYGFEAYAFNMMNYYEFASDRYVSFMAEHHFQGLFLNRIPLLRLLKLREVVTAKLLVGSIDEHNMQCLKLPEGMQSPNMPYAEVGVGLENILKLFRIDATWRLTHLDNPNIQKFGLRASIQFVL